MGLLSSKVSITRYKVEGRIEGPILEVVSSGLLKNSIKDIDNDASEKIVGWTSFDNPFSPDFKNSSVVFGTNLVFSLRIDKKNIPTKIIKKYYTIEKEKRLVQGGREYFSRNEKKMIKEHVINILGLRIPATPNIYDIVWNYEESLLWFFSNLKSANEELETIFSKSFKLNLIRLFPYTKADIMSGLSNEQRDDLKKLSVTKFME